VSASGDQKTTILGKFWHFGGSCTDPLLPMRAKFAVLQQTQRLHSRTKLDKNHNFRQILTFWGFLYWPPFTDEGQIQCAIPRSTLMCQILSQSVYFVALCWRKTQIFAFFGLRHLVVSPIGSSVRKLNTGVQLQTPSNDVKIASVLQCLPGKIGRTNSDVQKRDEHTNRQKLNVFGRPSGGWNPSPIKLGMVIEDLEHILASLKLGIPTHSFIVRGHSKFVTPWANPSKFRQLTHPETRYKFCKIREYRARDVGHLYSTFWSNLSKIFSFGGPIPLLLHQWGETWHGGPLLRAKFHPHWCNVSPLWGEKAQMSNLNNRRFALRAMLPVNNA